MKVNNGSGEVKFVVAGTSGQWEWAAKDAHTTILQVFTPLGNQAPSIEIIWDAYQRQIEAHSAPLVSKAEAGQIIRKAAEIIEKHGWIQGAIGSYAHGFCVLGAIVETRATRGNAAANMFFLWLVEVGGVDKFGSIPQWNDNITRTQEEVLQYMYKFADEYAPMSPLTELGETF